MRAHLQTKVSESRVKCLRLLDFVTCTVVHPCEISLHSLARGIIHKRANKDLKQPMRLNLIVFTSVMDYVSCYWKQNLTFCHVK